MRTIAAAAFVAFLPVPTVYFGLLLPMAVGLLCIYKALSTQQTEY